MIDKVIICSTFPLILQFQNTNAGQALVREAPAWRREVQRSLPWNNSFVTDNPQLLQHCWGQAPLAVIVTSETILFIAFKVLTSKCVVGSLFIYFLWEVILHLLNAPVPSTDQKGLTRRVAIGECLIIWNVTSGHDLLLSPLKT